MYTSAMNFVCGWIDPGFASTIPRSISSFSTPRSSTPMLSPATASSSTFRNISSPVATVFFACGRNPTISTSSPTFSPPRPPPPPPPLHPPRRHRPPPRDREDVLHAHQKRLVHVPLRRRNVRVHRVHQLPDAPRPRILPAPHLRLPLHRLQRLQRRPLDHRDLVPRKFILVQQVPHFHFHQLQQLRVRHHVHLVQKHHDVRHPHLPRQQNVLPRLRHRPVRRAHHQDRPVHLRRPGDHVLDVVRVPRTVHVRVVPLLRLVLHVADRDRDPPLLLLRRVVDLRERHRLRLPQRRQHPRDRRRQRRLPVIHVPDRPHVYVRLRPLKPCLRHPPASRLSGSPGESPTPGNPSGRECLRLAARPRFLHQLLRDVVRDLFIVRKLHRVRRAPLRIRPQRGRVPEHLRERHLGLHDPQCAPLLHRHDPAAAGVEVADHVAHVLVGRHRLDLHHGLQQHRRCRLRGRLERHRPGNLERHLRGVHVVV